MLTSNRQIVIVTAILIALAGMSVSAHGDLVDSELLLLVDVSGSVDGTEFGLVKGGYVAAWQSPSLLSIIQSGFYGKIAAALGYWSGQSEQVLAVGWSVISDQTSANAFAAAINAYARPYNGSTGIGPALSWGGGLFAANGHTGFTQMIDISGDGTNNDGISPSAGRTIALAAGVDVINGLPIGNATLQSYYATDVIGGGIGDSTAFIEPAVDFSSFQTALDKKVKAEVQEAVEFSNIPEPGSLILLGIGGVAVAAGIRRRRRRSSERSPR